MDKPQKANEMDFNFTLTKEEYATALLPCYSKGLLIIALLFVLNLTYSSVIDDYYKDSPQWPLKLLVFLLVYSLAVFLFLILMKWVLKQFIKISYKKSKVYSHPMHFELSDKGVSGESFIGHYFVKWSAYDDFKWGKDLCLLFITKTSRQIIPLRIFTDDQKKELKQLLSQHIKTKK